MTASRILVVDDESDIRSTLQEILADEGFEVEVAANADAAFSPPPRLFVACSWIRARR